MAQYVPLPTSVDLGQADNAGSVPVVLSSEQCEDGNINVLLHGKYTSKSIEVKELQTDSNGYLIVSAGSNIPVINGPGTTIAVSGTVDTVSIAQSVSITPTLDTNVYANGDVLFSASVSLGEFGAAFAELLSVTVIDKDDQGGALDLWFINGNISLGTANSAPNISDANAVALIGRVPIAAADYYDLGDAKAACIKNVGLLLPQYCYVSAISRDAKTYSASGLRFNFGLRS